MTVLAAVCTKMPEAKLAIILLPMFTFTAGSVSAFELQRNAALKTLSPYLFSIWACVLFLCVSKLLSLFWKRRGVIQVPGISSELVQPSRGITAECGKFRIILNSILHGSVSDLIQEVKEAGRESGSPVWGNLHSHPLLSDGRCFYSSTWNRLL